MATRYAGELGRPQRPPIAREAQPPGGIELLFDGRDERVDGVGPCAAQRGVTLLNARNHPLDAPDVGVAGAEVRQTHHPAAQRLIAPIDLALGLDFTPDGHRRGQHPIGRKLRPSLAQLVDGRRQQRHTLGRRFGEPRGRQRLLDRFAQRRRGQQRFNRRRRRGKRDEVEIEPPARRDAEVGDRLVEHRQQLTDVAVAIVVVGRRPVGQRLSRLLDDGEAPGGVGGLADFVQRLRDLIRQLGVVDLGLRLDVAAGAGGRRVSVGALPVHLIGGNVHEAQRSIRAGARRHREHDALADARDLAVTDERAAVLQKHAEHRRIVGGVGRERARQQAQHDQCARQLPMAH